VLEEMGRRAGPRKQPGAWGWAGKVGPPSSAWLARAAGDWRAWQRQWTRAFFQGNKQQQKQRPSSRPVSVGQSKSTPSISHWPLAAGCNAGESGQGLDGGIQLAASAVHTLHRVSFRNGLEQALGRGGTSAGGNAQRTGRESLPAVLQQRMTANETAVPPLPC
jgi:hypothetical protein